MKRIVVFLTGILCLLMVSCRTSDRQPIIAQDVRNLIAERKYEAAILMADSLDITLRKHLQDSARDVCNDILAQEIQIQMNSNHYSMAYVTCEKMYDGELKDATKNKIISKCEEYFQNRFKCVTNNKAWAKELLQALNQCEVPINDKDEIIAKLYAIINFHTPEGASISMSPASPSYTVKIWKANKSDQNPIYTVSRNQEITLEKREKYICKVFSNGQVVTAVGKAEFTSSNIKIDNNTGAISIYVSSDFGDNQKITIGNNLVISIKIQQ